MELRHLRCFVAVAEHGQVSAAAEALHVAQPALSQTIRQLERELGVELFERHPRGVRLTAAGEDFLAHARAAARASDEAVAAARAHGRERQRSLLVGFLPPLTSFAIDILNAYERDQPLIKITIEEISFADHVQAVRRHEVDVALVWAGIQAPGVVLDPLIEEPWAVCLSATHPLAGEPHLRFEQIEDEPIPRLPDGFPTAVSDVLHLAARRRRPARQTEQLPRSMDEGIWLIASGRAACAGPLSLARTLTRPGIVTVPLIDVEPVAVSIARRSDDSRAAVRAFSHIAREHLSAASTDRQAQPAS